MALTLDATSGHRTVATASTLTWAHTCTGSNRMLCVGVFNDTSTTVSSVTYNGTAMTLGPTGDGQAASEKVSLYYLIAPATGANNVVITCSGNNNIAGVGWSWTDAKQSAQPDASINGTGGASPGTLTVTTIADNSVAMLFVRTGTTWTASTNSTLTTNTASGGNEAQSYTGAFYTNLLKTPAGSLNMQATTTGGGWGGVMMSIAPVPVTANDAIFFGHFA